MFNFKILYMTAFLNGSSFLYASNLPVVDSSSSLSEWEDNEEQGGYCADREIEEFRPGDIVFFKDARGISEHVAIFVGLIDMLPFVVHSTTGKHQRIRTTLLREGSYDFYRHPNPKIAKKALELIQAWESTTVKFDHYRHDLHLFIAELKMHHQSKDMNPLESQYQYSKKLYNKMFYRIIKYGARGSHLHFKRSSGAHSTGVICSHAVALAFQIAEAAPYIKVLETERYGWVSDKYADSKLLDIFMVPSSYKEYLRSLNSLTEMPGMMMKRVSEKKEYTAVDNRLRPVKKIPTDDEKIFTPAIVAWDFNSFNDPEEFFLSDDRSFPLDCKTVSPEVMKYHCDLQLSSWQNQGQLHVSEIILSPKNSQDWSMRNKNLLEEAVRSEDELLRKISTSLTGSLYFSGQKSVSAPEELGSASRDAGGRKSRASESFFEE